MHERGGLQGMPGSLAGHLMRREPAQLPVNQGEQLLRRLKVPRLDGPEHEGDLAQ
jgi:hypothetical protein